MFKKLLNTLFKKLQNTLWSKNCKIHYVQKTTEYTMVKKQKTNKKKTPAKYTMFKNTKYTTVKKKNNNVIPPWRGHVLSWCLALHARDVMTSSRMYNMIKGKKQKPFAPCCIKNKL